MSYLVDHLGRMILCGGAPLEMDMALAARRRSSTGHPINVTPVPSGVAPGQVGTIVPGTPGTTTLPVSYAAPSAGTAPITYTGYHALHGSGTWSANSGTFTSTGGTFIGLMGGTNYDLRIVATNSLGSSTRDYLVGDTTATTGSWTNGLTATRYEIVLSRSSGAPGSAVSGLAYPNGSWAGDGTKALTLTPTNGTISGSLVIPASGSDPIGFSWTPLAAGELAIAGTNAARLANPFHAPFTCMIAAAGSAQTLSYNSSVTTDSNGGRLLDRRTYQKDAPSGNPNGFSTTANAGWGEVWVPLTLGGASSGLFGRLHDADSSGASSTVGTGTVVQAITQVFGPVSSGVQTVRLLLPATDTRYYLDLATDAAFTNPVRVPWTFFVRDVMALLVRSQEGGLGANWNAGTILPGAPYNAYTKTTGISTYHSGNDTSAADAVFASSWAVSDGVTTSFLQTNDGTYYEMNSAATMELGRLWNVRKGHGISTVGVVVVNGIQATFADMLATDGTPCAGFRQAVINQCGGKFRYLRTNMNDGGGPLSYGTAGCRVALNGLVSYFATNYPACAVMSLGIRSGSDADASANATATVGAVIREEMEATDPRVAFGDVIAEWFGFYGNHPDFPSQVKIARGVWQSLMGNETPTFGGFGYSFADRWPRLRSTGTRAAGTQVLKIPIDLPAGVTSIAAQTIHYNGSGNSYTYTAADSNDLLSITYVFPAGQRPGVSPYALASAVINASTNPPTLDITVDSSVTLPSIVTAFFGCNTNYGPYTPNGGNDPVAVFAVEDRSAYGIDYGRVLTPKLDITITTV